MSKPRLVALFIDVPPELNSEGVIRIAEAEARRIFKPAFRIRDVKYFRKFAGCVVFLEEQTQKIWKVRKVAT